MLKAIVKLLSAINIAFSLNIADVSIAIGKTAFYVINASTDYVLYNNQTPKCVNL